MDVNETDLAPVTGRVMALARAILARENAERSFGPEDPLVDVGLTSLDLVNLMLAVEAEFDLLIPPTELIPANFSTAAAVARMIASVLAGSKTLVPA